MFMFFFSSRRRHTRLTCDWSSDVCSSDLPRHRLIFVEEFGFTLAMTPAYARAPRGHRAYSAVPYNPGRNLTLTVGLRVRSEERRVGKECGSRWWREGYCEQDMRLLCACRE